MHFKFVTLAALAAIASAIPQATIVPVTVATITTVVPGITPAALPVPNNNTAAPLPTMPAPPNNITQAPTQPPPFNSGVSSNSIMIGQLVAAALVAAAGAGALL